MSDSLTAMSATLADLGIGEDLIVRGDWTIIAESPPELHEMGETYQAVNDHLAGLLSNGPLSIAHITGEARAIVDPAHRRVLRQAADYGQETAVACIFKTDGARPDAWCFVARQRQHWGPMRWFDLIDVMELAARRLIRICRLARAEDVHFSLFGEDLLLLQERHHHPTAEKWVWFVRSAPLVAALRPRLVRLLAEAVTIDPLSFDQILDCLNDYETLMALSSLAAVGGTGPQSADGLPESVGSSLSADAGDSRLEELGLIAPDGAGLTSLGREWLERISGQIQST